MSLEFTLYQALQSVGELDFPVGLPSSGKQFEDFMVRQLYTRLSQSPDEYRVLHLVTPLIMLLFRGFIISLI